MNGFFTLEQSLPVLFLLVFVGIILLWLSARSVRLVARDMYRTAQIHENIAREQFENDLIRTRWQVWRNYTTEIISLAAWFNEVRAAYLRDQNPDLVLKYDQDGAEMIWAFGYEEIGVEVSTMSEIIENLVTQVRTPMGRLQEAWQLSEMEKEASIRESWQEVQKIWEDTSPRIQRKLKEIELKIRANMPLHTEPLPQKEREKQKRRWQKAEEFRQKQERRGWFSFGKKKKETQLIRKL
ncbi:hypothetical protein FAI41_04275 [Acetobacteraceae bacterium]|nr:hypothetical protein FAI41_04275 [Acetobacteraceae bacterium]